MDSIKDHIASEVASAITMFEHRGIMDANVDRVTVSHPTKLTSQIRVVLKQGGTRYFTVKLSESL